MSEASYRTAFITGASSGIGDALARRLARAGVEVALGARRAEALQTLASDIRREGGQAHVYPLDVSDPEDATSTIRRADDELGGLDLVVANAGVGRDHWSGKLTWKDCSDIIDVNVRGAVATLTAVVPRMAKRKRGHVAGISSLAAYRGMPRNAAYAASKAFLSTFLESMRVDLRSVDVAVTDVRPGFVQTAMTEKNQFHMPFLVTPEDAAETIFHGLRRREAVVAFPWQLATLVRSSSMLPASVWDRAVGRALGK
jgi:short-subunit dehydrogenase